MIPEIKSNSAPSPSTDSKKASPPKNLAIKIIKTTDQKSPSKKIAPTIDLKSPIDDKEPSLTSKIAYHVSLQFNRISSVRGWNWWDKIFEKNGAEIYLGAIPLDRNYGFTKNFDSETLIKQHKIGAVLSVVETFENHSEGIFTSTVTNEDWKKKGVDHLQLPAADFGPVPREYLEKGTDFIKENLDKKKNVYVHCKAGRGRSALMLACYLVRYEKYTADQALKFIISKRPQVHLNHAQFIALMHFETSL